MYIFFVCSFFALVTRRDVNKTEQKSDRTSDQIRDIEIFFKIGQGEGSLSSDLKGGRGEAEETLS